MSGWNKAQHVNGFSCVYFLFYIVEHMYNRAVLPASTAKILINSWCKAEHLNGYFMLVVLKCEVDD
jgi:hypothetical protein